MVHDLFYRSHPFERQLSLHFRIVGKVFFKLIIRISDSQRPSPASERQLTIWLILFYHVFRTVSTFFLRVCQWTMPLPVCSVCCSFFCGDRRWCGTRSSIPAICVPRIAHFFLHKVLKTAPAWHTNLEFAAAVTPYGRSSVFFHLWPYRGGRWYGRIPPLPYLRPYK